jgi:acyl carrier protein
MLTKSSPACDVLPSRDRVLEDVKRIVSESSGVPFEQIDETETLLRDLPWDSLDLVECAMEIEEQFGINVPDELMDQAKTVGDVADGVLMLLAKAEAEAQAEG